MKRKIAGMCLLPGLVFVLAFPVHAETYPQEDLNWHVSFTPEKKMESNFTGSQINQIASGMQPGDNAVMRIDVKNTNSTTTDWYMKNDVLDSLEDDSLTADGGAYTYRLSYVVGNTETVLYDSDTVGGEGGEREEFLNRMGRGLNGATSSLDSWFYLDTLEVGEGGTVILEVALDGESQGNSYQDTLANLALDFAVEMRNTPPGDHRRRRDEEPAAPLPPAGNVTGTGIVQTGDDSRIVLYSAVGGISGIMLLLFCLYSWRERRREREEA